MRIKKKGIFLITSFILIAFLYSCGKVDDTLSPKTNIIDIELGSLIEEKGSGISNLNLTETGYKKVQNDDPIVEYNKKSGNYIFIRNNRHYFYSKGKEKKLEENNYENLHLSNDGKYLGYMVYDNIYTLKVLNIEDNKQVNINSKVSISGKFFDFIGENTLIYYGISEKKENGIFSYNLETGKEELIYKIDSGYLEFFKSYKDEIIFLQRVNEDEKLLKSLKLKDKSVETLSSNIDLLSDVLKSENNYYILGSTKNDKNSLYILSDGELDRVVYDFPEKIEMKSGLSINKSGEILFMGSNTGETNLDVYSYSKDNGINLLTENSGKYNFIKIN